MKAVNIHRFGAGFVHGLRYREKSCLSVGFFLASYQVALYPQIIAIGTVLPFMRSVVLYDLFPYRFVRITDSYPSAIIVSVASHTRQYFTPDIKVYPATDYLLIWAVKMIAFVKFAHWLVLCA